MQVLQDALVSSSWSVEAAMALLCEGDSVGDKKKRPADARSRKKGKTAWWRYIYGNICGSDTSAVPRWL
jgi:hypothetical protein